MEDVHKTGQYQHYRIVVEGALDAVWGEWFSDLQIAVDDGNDAITTLSGPVADQAALRGILNKLWDLNLSVILVKRLRI